MASPITPSGQPGVPRVDTQNLDQALASMAQIAERMNTSSQATVELLRHLDRVTRSSKDVERNLHGWGLEFSTTMGHAADLEYTLKRIQKLRAMRVSGGTTQSGTAAYIQNLQKEYRILLQVLNTGQGQGRHIKEVNKALGVLDKTLAQVRRTSASTWDADAIRDVNNALAQTAQRVGDVQKAIAKVQVNKFSHSLHELRKTMDEAFGGDFTATLRRIPGVAGFMDARRFKRQALQAQKGLKEFSSRQTATAQASYRSTAHAVRDAHGPKGIGVLRSMGYHHGRPVGNKLYTGGNVKGHRLPPLRGGGGAASSGAAARAGDSLEQMTVKTMTVENMHVGKPGAKPSALGNNVRALAGGLVGPNGQPIASTPQAAGRPSWMRAAARNGLAAQLNAAAPSQQAVQATLASTTGSGGALAQRFNGLVGRMAQAPNGGGGFLTRMAQSLLTKGGGNAAAGVGAAASGLGAGILGSGAGLVAKASAPLMVLKGIMDLHDKIVLENKKVQENLGTLGIHGTTGDTGFRDVRRSLLSTGMTKAALWGQGLDENMKIMSTIGEGGLAVGGTLRRGVNLGDALEQRAGLQGGGFYGTIMKNALVNGRNLGMGQDQSVRLTLKLVERFGKTMDSTQDFFVGLDDMMQASGVTASKYVDIIDNITDEFNDMNKSLTSTVGVLNTLGRSGRLTGDAMQTILKNLQAPNQMSLAQRMYAVGSMTPEDKAHATDALKASMQRDLEELAKSLKQAGVVWDKNNSIADQQESIRMQLRERLKDNPEEYKAQETALEQTMNRYASNRAQIQGLNSRNPLEAAAAAEIGGESGTMAMYTKQATLRNIAKHGGFSQEETQRLLGGDLSLATRLQNTGVVAAFKAQNPLQGDFDFMKAVQAQAQVRREGAMTATSFGRDAKDLDELLKGPQGQTRYAAMLALQKARVRAGLAKGHTGEGADDRMVQDFMGEAKKGNGEVLIKELQSLDETFAQVTSVGSALQKALQANIDRAAAREKAEKILADTRPIAEIFAKSFEYLFDQLLSVLSKTARILSPGSWFAKRAGEDAAKTPEWVRQRVEGAKQLREGIDESKLDDAGKKELTRLNNVLETLPDVKDNQKDAVTKGLIAGYRKLRDASGVQGGAGIEAATWAQNSMVDLKNADGSWRGYAWGSLKSGDDAARQAQNANGGLTAHRTDLGKSLVAAVTSTGAKGADASSALTAALNPLGHFPDLAKQYDTKGNLTLTSSSAGMTEILDYVAKQLKDNMSAGVRNANGTVNYTIFSNPTHNHNVAPTTANAGANNPQAKQVQPANKEGAK